MSTVTNKATPPRKTKPKGRHPDKALSAAFVRTAPPGRHADGNGLYLFVQPSGTRSWIQRLLIRGRRRELGLGSVALVSLAEAREKALANRKLAREGGDPLAEKRRRQGVPSFAEATARVVEQKQAGWRNRAHGRDWILTFERYAFPRIGKMPVSEVTSADMLEILAPIWHTKADTARRLRQRIRAVLEWAVVELIDKRMLALNEEIRKDIKNLGPGFQIGHSYFVPSGDEEALDEEWYRSVVRTQIVPLLKEYWFDQPARVDEFRDMLLA